MTDGEGETRDGFCFWVALFLDDIEDVDAGETYDVCGHLSGSAVDDMASDRFAVEKFIIIGSDFLSGFADFIGKRAPEGVVVFAEKGDEGIDILFAYTVDPVFHRLPCYFSSGCMFYVHVSLREIT